MLRIPFACLLLVTVVVAQAPVQYKLSAEATKEFIVVEREKQALIEKLKEAINRQRLLMVGAQVPEAARDNCQLDKDQLVCSVPAPSPSPK